MLRFAITFFVNRALLLAALLLFLNAYTRHSCHAATPYFQTVRDALEGWKELQRALR